MCHRDGRGGAAEALRRGVLVLPDADDPESLLEGDGCAANVEDVVSGKTPPRVDIKDADQATAGMQRDGQLAPDTRDGLPVARVGEHVVDQNLLVARVRGPGQAHPRLDAVKDKPLTVSRDAAQQPAAGEVDARQQVTVGGQRSADPVRDGVRVGRAGHVDASDPRHRADLAQGRPRRTRPGQQVALGHVDTELAEHVELLESLQALGDRRGAGRTGQCVQRSDQRTAPRVAVDAEMMKRSIFTNAGSSCSTCAMFA